MEEIVPIKIQESLKELSYKLSDDARNPRLCGILDATVLEGGKRLRPLLTFLMGDFLGLEHQDLAPYAIDIERIHAATLAHDDVVDAAKLRRGRATLNEVTSNKKAILAGDYLLAHVLQEVAGRGDARVVKELSRVIADLVEGEWLQIENAESKKLTFADIEKVALKKTGSVIRWTCMAPALLKGLDEETLQWCQTFGECLGVAFQLGDDLLDYTRVDGGALADMESGVVSSVIFYLAARDASQLDASCLDFKKLPKDPESLKVAMAKVRRELDRHLRLARESFDKIQKRLSSTPTSGEATVKALRGLLHYLSIRV